MKASTNPDSTRTFSGYSLNVHFDTKHVNHLTVTMRMAILADTNSNEYAVGFCYSQT